MLSVVTLSSTAPETCHKTPEVISTASDVATARACLLSDLALSVEPDSAYYASVLAWFDTARDTPGMITNPDGTVDVWMFDAEEDHLAA